MTRILHRQQLITPEASAQATPWIRFCAPQPNDLGQMDFKGHFALTTAARCQPLTVLDDHSRFALGIRALSSQQAALVKPELIALFRRYGLPNRILCDNTGPWGTATPGRYTALGIWLLHLDVRVIHGRPYHPQTQGKEERFHRTLATEVLQAQSFGSLAQVQDAFDAWRTVYNLQRPHEALDLQPPGSRYQLSPRVYPETLPPVEYDQGELVRRVHSRGEISLQGRFYHLGEGLCGQPVALRPTADPAILAVYFRHYLVAQLDLHHPAEAG
jgi:transposase InsO family protein